MTTYDLTILDQRPNRLHEDRVAELEQQAQHERAGAAQARALEARAKAVAEARETNADAIETAIARLRGAARL